MHCHPEQRCPALFRARFARDLLFRGLSQTCHPESQAIFWPNIARDLLLLGLVIQSVAKDLALCFAFVTLSECSESKGNAFAFSDRTELCYLLPSCFVSDTRLNTVLSGSVSVPSILF